MYKTVFQFLNHQNPKDYYHSPEMEYFRSHLLLFTPATREFRNIQNLFSLLRSTVILHSLENRKTLNNLIKNNDEEYLSKIEKLDHFELADEEIYIPTYSPSINRRYKKNPESLLEFPYDALIKDEKASFEEPSETYGLLPFLTFTSLIPLNAQKGNCKAYYHQACETVLVITDDGFLETSFTVFDEKVEREKREDPIDRLSKLMEDYFANKREAFYEDFLTYGLVSEKFHSRIMEYKKKRDRKTNRRFSSK